MVVQVMMPLPSFTLRKFSTKFYLTQRIADQIHAFYQTRTGLQFNPFCPGTKEKSYSRRDSHRFITFLDLIQTQSSQQGQRTVPWSLLSQHKTWSPIQRRCELPPG